MTISQTIGLVAHLRLNGVLKGSHGVEFELVAVDLTDSHTAAQALHDLKALDLSDAFTIAAPSPSPDVEQPGGGDDQRTATATVAPPPTIDELRASVADWSPADRGALKAFLEGRDATDPAVVTAAIDKVKGFHDVATVPAVRDVQVTLPTAPDEGDDADDATVELLSKRHARLDSAGKAFVGAVIAEAAAGGLHCHMGGDTGRRTRRRYNIMAGLVALADGLANDDAIRGCAAAAIGGEIADSKAWTWGQIVGAMDADEAATFASACEALSTGGASLRFIPAARVEVAA
jgi:hypothetical protein